MRKWSIADVACRADAGRSAAAPGLSGPFAHILTPQCGCSLAHILTPSAAAASLLGVSRLNLTRAEHH